MFTDCLLNDHFQAYLQVTGIPLAQMKLFYDVASVHLIGPL